MPLQRGGAVKGLQDRDAVGAAAADVIDLAAARVLDEGVDEAGDVQRMDVVADLFAFVAEDLVEAAFDVALDQVAQKAVQFHAAVVGAGQAAAAQAAGLHAEVAAVFLHHDVARHFRGAEQAVFALVDGKILGDAVGVGAGHRNPSGWEVP